MSFMAACQVLWTARRATVAIAATSIVSLTLPGLAVAEGRDLVCQPSRKPAATVLVLRGGYFARGDARSAQPKRACRAFARAGARAVSVDFPNRRFFTAQKYIRRVVTRERRRGPKRLLAYGESAGGTFVAWLAQRRLVDSGVAVAPPTNLLTWGADDLNYWHDVMHMTLADRRRASPVFGPSRCSPLLLLASPQDEIVPFQQSVELHRRLSTCSVLGKLTGRHLEDRSALPRGRRWLLAQARHAA